MLSSLFSQLKFHPWMILNVSITDLKSLEPPVGNHYVIFWYQKVPLGHLWYNKPLDKNSFRKAAVNAVSSALSYYSGLGERSTDEWISLIESPELPDWFASAAPVHSPIKAEPVSVVICTRNRPDALRVCIDQLLQSEDQNFELIVVDNASDDDSTRKVTELYPDVRYVREDRKGLDIARNTGIKNAGYEIVAFTDDDVSVDPSWISQIKRSFESPQTMAVTGLIIPKELNSKAQYIFERDWGFNKGYLPKTFDYTFFKNYINEGVPVWDIGAGASMAFRKTIFQLTGNFDVRLDVGASGCSGDSEIWYRVLAEGWNCFYNPHLLVCHQHRSTMKELKHQLFSYMRGHVSALLVQHEKYQHEGNLKQLHKNIPLWYINRVKLFLKTLTAAYIKTMYIEIAGCFSGYRYYYKNKLKAIPKQLEIPANLLEPAVVNPETKISVIIPCYNFGHFLKQTIDSIKSQTHAIYEIIVVDDGSDDKTAEICKSYEDVKYVQTPHAGVSIARNTGVAYSTGDYLVFLDADDILYQNALEVNLYFFKHYPELVMVSGAYDLINEKGGDIPHEMEPQQHKGDFYEALLSGNFIGMQSNIMYRKQLFFHFHFDSQLKICEDYDLNLRISRYLPAFSHTKKIAAYRRHENNASVNCSLMNTAAIDVLNKQRPHLRTLSEQRALQTGLVNWDKYYRIHNTSTRTPQEPPVILPLKTLEKRPKWSVMVPTYNCYPYIKECLESVMMQNIPMDEMQIEVVDDYSTDGDVERLVNEIGKGRIGYFRQQKNSGSLRNFETCINHAKGEYVHLLHGDDKVNHGFYKETGKLFEQYPDAGAVFSDFEYIDNRSNKLLYSEEPLMKSSGVINNWLERIALSQRVQPPSMVIKRSVYEHLGSYCAVHYGEDWEMYVRIAANYQVAHCVKPLAQYRVHGTNITSRSLLSGQNVRDIKKVISLIQKYLPEEKRSEISRASSKHFSIYFASISDKIYHDYNNPPAAMKQAYLALMMHFNLVTLKFMIKNIVKTAIGYKSTADLARVRKIIPEAQSFSFKSQDKRKVNSAQEENVHMHI